MKGQKSHNVQNEYSIFSLRITHIFFTVLAIMLLLPASYIYAQRTFNLFGTDVSIGVRAGGTYSHITKSNHSDGKLGWLIGADLEIPVDKVSEDFFIQPSLLFLSKGDKCSTSGDVGDGDVATVETTENAIFMEIPVMAGYRLNIADNFNLTFNAGPYFAFGLGGKSELGMDATLWGSPIGGGYEINTFDSIKRFDFGIGLGAGLEILQSWSVNLNYDFGLIPVIDGGGKHRAFMFSVGYKF
ncbi:putative outer membrane insertion C-signal [Bacteroides sp. CAG:1076]|nr:putative outer membrane insertion C-signal [Bacteroides sp. CAG:1076]